LKVGCTKDSTVAPSWPLDNIDPLEIVRRRIPHPPFLGR